MNTAILGTGSYLPREVLTSIELGERLGVGERWILEKTGIRERRVAASDEVTSDLATYAALRAIDDAGIAATEIDLLILSTSTPDQPVPATACFVQAKLGASRAAVFDVAAGCTGFLHSVSVAHAMLMTDPRCRTALVIGAGLYSRFLDYRDKRTCVLFGDGAGAVVLGKSSRAGILTSRLASDGTLAHVAQIPAGGSRTPASPTSVEAGQHYVHLRGGDIRRLVAKLVPELVSDLLEETGIGLPDVDLIVPHQANGSMMAEWRESLNVSPGVMHETIEWCGNTGAASIPITLDDAVRRRRVSAGDVILLVGFGAGVTWGGVTIKWLTQR